MGSRCPAVIGPYRVVKPGFGVGDIWALDSQRDLQQHVVGLITRSGLSRLFGQRGDFPGGSVHSRTRGFGQQAEADGAIPWSIPTASAASCCCRGDVTAVAAGLKPCGVTLYWANVSHETAPLDRHQWLCRNHAIEDCLWTKLSANQYLALMAQQASACLGQRFADAVQN